MKSSRLLTAGCVVLVGLVGFFDYLTGHEWGFSLFYLIPISISSWNAGRGPGLLVAILAAGAWLWADSASGHAYSAAFIPYWNMVVRLGFFVTVAVLLAARKRVGEALQRSHDELETRVQQRTAELSAANEQLQVEIEERQRAAEAIRELSVRLLQAQDEERRRLARELHDTTSQNLAMLALNFSVLNGSGAAPEPRAQRALTESRALLQETLREVRTLSYLLHPPLLEENGLAFALRAYTEGFSQRSGVRTEIDVAPEFGRLSREAELALFRVAQEALTNIHRHSGSAVAKVRLSVEPGGVALEVSDEGRGLAPEVLEKIRSGEIVLGVGVAGMRERLKQLGGQLQIESGGQGTRVTAKLPLREA